MASLAGGAGPIGVFDSGVGGLTVLKALRTLLPAQDFIYLGDTARLPYGSKSRATVERYSLQCARVLVQRGVRALVVACNTASAAALPALRAEHPELAIFGVIEPGAAAAVRASCNRRIAVIATLSTVQGGAYDRQIRMLAPDVQVRTLACPLFVALAEEGWTEGSIAQAVARRYLDPLFAAADPPDVLVLGCTHFPLLREVIGSVIPAGVSLVDSAHTTATEVAAALGSDRSAPKEGRVNWLATDGAARFAQVGSRFLGRPIDAAEVDLVDL